MVLDRRKKIAHLRLLVDGVVREQQAARTEPRKRQIEESLVVAFPGVEKQEIEVRFYSRKLLERAPRHDGDDFRKTRPPNVLLGGSGAPGVHFNRRQTAAGLAQAQADPDGAVTAGPSDFQSVSGAARGHYHAKELSIALRNGKMLGVGRFDFAKKVEQIGRQRRSRGLRMFGGRRKQPSQNRGDSDIGSHLVK